MDEKAYCQPTLKCNPDFSTDLYLVDRGFIDSYFFSEKLFRDGVCTREELDDFLAFLDKFKERLTPDGIIFFTVDPEEAIKRRGGKEGHIVTKSFLNDYNKMLKTFIEAQTVPHTEIDTTGQSIDTVVKICLAFIQQIY